MIKGRNRKLSVFAPAKINLFLHVTGRRDNGYHELQSLIAFADIGDRIDMSPDSDFSFAVKGPYARNFTAQEKDASPNSANLVVRAAWELAHALQREPKVKLVLHKNLPLAAGLGGGSSDAAAMIWGLLELWGLTPQAVPRLDQIMLSLGADVPASFACRPVMAEGIGEIITPTGPMPEIPVLLVNPGKLCPTARIFEQFDTPFSSSIILPERLEPTADLISFLGSLTENMLTVAAVKTVPEISAVLDALEKQEGCRLARMSGSGATCFGLFADEEAAMEAAEHIVMKNPGWWVRAGMLNRPERY